MTSPKTEYRTISLSRGQQTIVTPEHYAKYGHLNWYAFWSGRRFYAARFIRVSGKKRMVFLHREILGLGHGNPLRGDHINGDSLNNLCTLDPETNNLRLATHSQNLQNSGIHRTSKSGLKGVSRWKHKWQAHICLNGERIYLGLFDTKEEAYAAYCAAAKKHFGEFARLT